MTSFFLQKRKPPALEGTRDLKAQPDMFVRDITKSIVVMVRC